MSWKRKVYSPRKCGICGTEFVPKRCDSTTCSRQCYRKYSGEVHEAHTLNWWQPGEKEKLVQRCKAVLLDPEGFGFDAVVERFGEYCRKLALASMTEEEKETRKRIMAEQHAPVTGAPRGTFVVWPRRRGQERVA